MRIELVQLSEIAVTIQYCKYQTLYLCTNEPGVFIKTSSGSMFNLNHTQGSNNPRNVGVSTTNGRENLFTPLPNGTKIILTQS